MKKAYGCYNIKYFNCVYNLNQLQTNSYKLIPNRENYSSYYFMYMRLLQ